MCWACCPAWCSVMGSILLWASGRGDFSPWVLVWVLTPFPTTLLDESINQGLVCTHMHSSVQTQKILTFMSLMSECWHQKHTQQTPSTKTECDYLYGWIKQWSHTRKSHKPKKLVIPRDIAGNARKKKKVNKCVKKKGSQQVLLSHDLVILSQGEGHWKWPNR